MNYIWIFIGVIFSLWILHIIFGDNRNYTVEDFEREIEEEYDYDRWMAYQEKCKREGREP